MKVYTKTGDEGKTSLFSKERVFKDDLRVDAYGTVDEASSAMGLAKSLIKESWAITIIQQIQAELIDLNADLATENLLETNSHITQKHVAGLELTIDALEQKRIPQHYFIIPGACSGSAALDLARTMVRRAERCVVRLRKTAAVTRPVALYLNRLSDLLFVLARCVEQEEMIITIKHKVLSIVEGNMQKKLEQQSDSMLIRAKKMIEAAEQKAIEIGVPMVIAVVDMGGNLVAQHRMDGSLLASLSVSLDKAYTAVALKTPTDQIAAVVQPGQPLFGLNTTDGGRLIVFSGGFPIYTNGNIIGGFGVSGGSAEEDLIVANAGLAVTN